MQLFSSTKPSAPHPNGAQGVLDGVATLDLSQTAKQIASISISTRLVNCEELVQDGLSVHFPPFSFSLSPFSFSLSLLLLDSPQCLFSPEGRACALVQALEPWGHLLFHSTS